MKVLFCCSSAERAWGARSPLLLGAARGQTGKGGFRRRRRRRRPARDGGHDVEEQEEDDDAESPVAVRAAWWRCTTTNIIPSSFFFCALRASVRVTETEKQSKSRFSSLRSPLRTPDVGRPARGVARDVATFPTLPPGWVSSFSRLVSALGDRHLMRVTVHKISWKGCLARFSGNVALRVFPGNPTWRKDRGYGILKICLMEKPSFPRRNFVV